MAELESTTPCTHDVKETPSAAATKKKFEPRLLTVNDCIIYERVFDPVYDASREPPKHAPFLRLKGRWLDQAGFPIGSKVRVEVSHGRLVIEALPQFPERTPHLPRRAQKLFF